MFYEEIDASEIIPDIVKKPLQILYLFFHGIIEGKMKKGKCKNVSVLRTDMASSLALFETLPDQIGLAERDAAVVARNALVCHDRKSLPGEPVPDPVQKIPVLKGAAA
jgi:hypothetical protein